MPYILNLASPDDEVYLRSLESLSVELERCSALGIPMVVTHIGSHMGSGPERGVSRVVEGVRVVLERDESGVMVLLENGPGSRNSVGSGFEELELILDGVDRPDRVAVCLDTCHAFAAGHDLRTEEGLEKMVCAFDDSIGIERLMLVHLNDSVGGLGRGVDHHEHIGLGEIGIDGFRRIMGSRLAAAPMVMETPSDERRTDEENMRLARGLVSA